jgi:hypothetical protein
MTAMADAQNKAITRQADNDIGSKPTFMTQRIIQTYIKPLKSGDIVARRTPSHTFAAATPRSRHSKVAP